MVNRSILRDRKYLVKLTGAIGDLVLFSAVREELHRLGATAVVINSEFTLGLQKGFEGVSESFSKVPKERKKEVIDVSDYAGSYPHQNPLPDTNRIGHLAEWLGVTFEKQAGLPLYTLKVRSDNVRICLNGEEVEFGRDYIHKFQQDNGDGKKPVVILAPYSSIDRKKHNLETSILEELVPMISGFGIPALLEPFSDEQYIEGTIPIGDKDLRKASAILLAAQGYLGVDSGPLHMAAGAVQGVSDAQRSETSNLSKIVVALGSSHIKSVAYGSDDNELGMTNVIFKTGGCPVSPCGNPGYPPNDKYTEFFEKKEILLPNPFGENHCIYSGPKEYSCMKGHSASELSEALREAVRN